MKLLYTTILVLFSLGMVACSQNALVHNIDEFLEEGFYYAPLDEYSNNIWQIITLSREQQSIYLGLMNEEEQTLGEWHPYTLERHALIMQIEDQKARVTAMKSGRVLLEFEDGELISFTKVTDIK